MPKTSDKRETAKSTTNKYKGIPSERIRSAYMTTRKHYFLLIKR